MLTILMYRPDVLVATRSEKPFAPHIDPTFIGPGIDFRLLQEATDPYVSKIGLPKIPMASILRYTILGKPNFTGAVIKLDKLAESSPFAGEEQKTALTIVEYNYPQKIRVSFPRPDLKWLLQHPKQLGDNTSYTYEETNGLSVVAISYTSPEYLIERLGQTDGIKETRKNGLRLAPRYYLRFAEPFLNQE